VSEAFGRLLGSGKEAEVFEYGADVLKLYRSAAAKRSAFREAAILALVESLGLPVPRPRSVGVFAERWGIVMSRAKGPSYGETIIGDPASVGAHVEAMCVLHQRIHAASGVGLESLPGRLARRIADTALLGARRERLLVRLAQMPSGDRLCHGDFHPSNIMGAVGSETVVDWLDATCGEPAADVCRSHVLISSVRPDLADAYVDAYCRTSGTAKVAIFAWRPFIAAARSAENVPEEVPRLLKIVDSALL
jgi:Ser/Thr protein kinase RdoA (MazF antagonist)